MCVYEGVYEAWCPEVFRSAERSVVEWLAGAASSVLSGSYEPPEIPPHEGESLLSSAGTANVY